MLLLLLLLRLAPCRDGCRLLLWLGRCCWSTKEALDA
jgi:hypothetical protein